VTSAHDSRETQETHRPPAAVPAVSAAVRALAVLDRLSRQRSVGLEELSRQVQLAKPTVYRFC